MSSRPPSPRPPRVSRSRSPSPPPPYRASSTGPSTGASVSGFFHDLKVRLSLPSSTSSSSAYAPLPQSASAPTPYARRRGSFVFGPITRSPRFVKLGLAVACMIIFFALLPVNTDLDIASASDKLNELYTSGREKLGSIGSGSSPAPHKWAADPAPPIWDGWFHDKVAEAEAGCAGWDHEAPEEYDPPDCLRARQYRQTMRVLAREERAEHERWWFTTDDNIVTLYELRRCFLPLDHFNYTKCPDHPVIIQAWWWTNIIPEHNTHSGEAIWMGSVLEQLEQFGIFSLNVGVYENWITTAEMMPDVYRYIWAGDMDGVSCMSDPRCIRKEDYVPSINGTDLSIGVPDEERGVIPIWKIQIVDYFGSMPAEDSVVGYYWGVTWEGEWSFHPLGFDWIATPWAQPKQYHLPYSIEDVCLKTPSIPHAERNNTVLILAKRSSYFHYVYVSDISFWTKLSKEPGVHVISAAEVEEGSPMPDGVETLGYQTREGYELLVGSVKVMLGMGSPPLSPSVYTALCQGTPLVMPYDLGGYSTEGWHKFSIHAQHTPALAIGPPYVYAYDKDNYTQMSEAVHTAMQTPIKRYIPDDMRLTYAMAQMKKYLHRDMYKMYLKVIGKNGGKVPQQWPGIIERCFELNRCSKLPEGRTPRTTAFWQKVESGEIVFSEAKPKKPEPEPEPVTEPEAEAEAPAPTTAAEEVKAEVDEKEKESKQEEEAVVEEIVAEEKIEEDKQAEAVAEAKEEAKEAAQADEAAKSEEAAAEQKLEEAEAKMEAEAEIKAEAELEAKVEMEMALQGDLGFKKARRMKRAAEMKGMQDILEFERMRAREESSVEKMARVKRWLATGGEL